MLNVPKYLTETLKNSINSLLTQSIDLCGIGLNYYSVSIFVWKLMGVSVQTSIAGVC